MPKKRRNRVAREEWEDPQEPAVKRAWMELEESTRHEVVATLGLLAAVALAVALATHSPADVPLGGAYTTGPKDGLANWMGWPGAWLAEILLSGLGYCAWIVPALLALASLRGFRTVRRPPWALQSVSAALLLASTCGLLTLIALDGSTAESGFAWGGLVGSYVGHLSRWFGPLGAYLLLLAGATVGLVLCTNIGPWSMARMGGRHLGHALKSVPRPSLRIRREVEIDDPVETFPEMTLPANSLEEELVLRVDGYAPLDDGLAVEPPPDDVIRVDDAFDGPFIAPVDEETFAIPEEFSTPPAESPASPDQVSLQITTDMTELLDSRARRKSKKEPKPRRKERESDGAYELPPLDLLNLPLTAGAEIYRDEIQQNSMILSQTLREFGMECRVVAVSCGPVVTRYEMQPPPGVKI